MQTLNELFHRSVEKFSAKVLLIMRPRWRTIRWTGQDLHNYAEGIAARLAEQGIGLQDRVVLIGPNSPYWVGAFFGVLLRGGIVVPLNPQSGEDFIEKIVDQTKAKAILKATHISYDKAAVPVFDIDAMGELASQHTPRSAVSVQPDHIAEIVYTSGTTGDPKGVVLTHQNIMANVDAISKVFKPSPRDRTVSVLPLFHMYGQTAEMFTVLKYGVSVMFAPSVSSRAIRQCLQKQKATKLLLVPELLETIIHHIEDQAARAGKSKRLAQMFSLASRLPFCLRRLLFRRVHKNFGGCLRLLATGGAPLDEETWRKWHAMGFMVLQGYGLTETSPAMTTNVLGDMKIGSVGKPLPGVEVTIAADGEILAKGPNVFSGYYLDEEKTKAVFDEQGRFKTGDLGYFDDDGFLFIHGRKKYVIVSASGENIYPDDIESVLRKIPGIIDTAVIGVKRNGRELVHAVLLGDIDDPQAIIEQANQQLASYQRIAEWSVWPDADFPRSATRKVKKEPVIAWVEAQKGVVAPAEPPLQISPLVRLLSSISGKAPAIITDETNLFRDLHFDSLMRIELVSRIEELFDVAIQEHGITARTTVKDLKKLMEKGEKVAPRRPIKKWPLWKPLILFRAIVHRSIAFPLYWLWITLKVEDSQYLDDLELPAIFMANHTTFADAVIVLWALPSRIRRKVALSAARDFVYGDYWYLVWLLEIFFNCYPFPRKETDDIKPGLDATGSLLDRGFSILVFPEGKVSESGEFQKLKRGAGLLATQMDVPVVPVIIKGLRDLIPMGKVLPRKKGTVTIRFGKPLKFVFSDSYIEVTNDVEQAMKDLF